jgi:hypothetical protein
MPFAIELTLKSRGDASQAGVVGKLGFVLLPSDSVLAD